MRIILIAFFYVHPKRLRLSSDIPHNSINIGHPRKPSGHFKMPLAYIMIRVIIVLLLFCTESTAQPKIQRLADKLTQDKEGDHQKLEAIYRWVTHHIDYDPSLLSNASARKYSDEQKPLTVLRTKKAVCQGYANLTQSLLKAIGMESYTVIGYSKNVVNQSIGSHAWNVVNLDDSWYLLDPTWDAGYIEKGKYVRRPSKDHFLIDPSSFVKNHWPDDPIWQLMAKPVSKCQFIECDAGHSQEGAAEDYLDTLQNYLGLDHEERKFNSATRSIRFDPDNGAGYYSLAMAYFDKANQLGEQYHLSTESLHFVYDWIAHRPDLLNILGEQKVLLTSSKALFEYLIQSSVEYRDVANQNIHIIKSVFKSIEYEMTMINNMNHE